MNWAGESAVGPGYPAAVRSCVTGRSKTSERLATMLRRGRDAPRSHRLIVCCPMSPSRRASSAWSHPRFARSCLITAPISNSTELWYAVNAYECKAPHTSGSNCPSAAGGAACGTHVRAMKVRREHQQICLLAADNRGDARPPQCFAAARRRCPSITSWPSRTRPMRMGCSNPYSYRLPTSSSRFANSTSCADCGLTGGAGLNEESSAHTGAARSAGSPHSWPIEQVNAVMTPGLVR